MVCESIWLQIARGAFDMLLTTGCKAIEGGFQMTMVKCAEYTITIWILN